MKRRFELAGLPGSFFELEHQGTNLHVAFGPRGRNVPPRTRAFPSEAAAQAEAQKLIGAHLAKGYAEKIETPPPMDGFERLRWVKAQVERAKAGVAAPPNPALEDACTTDDPAPWHVFADWLTEQGDPRGEIALAWLRGMNVDATNVLIQAIPHVRAFKHDQAGVYLDEIRHGFVCRALVGIAPEGPPVILEDFLRSPLAASLRELTIGLGTDGDWTPALEVLCASSIAPRLERLAFDASDYLPNDEDQYQQAVERELEEIERRAGIKYRDEDEEPSDTHVQQAQAIVDSYVAQVSPVRFAPTAPWSALAALESLTIDGPFRGDLGILDLPNLRELVIRSDRLKTVTAIASADCPNLQRLELWCGPLDKPDLQPLAADGMFPQLRELALFDTDESLIAAIRKSDLLKRVKLQTGVRTDIARYADPLDRDRPGGLPRGGEPPPTKRTAKTRRTKKPK